MKKLSEWLEENGDRMVNPSDLEDIVRPIALAWTPESEETVWSVPRGNQQPTWFPWCPSEHSLIALNSGDVVPTEEDAIWENKRREVVGKLQRMAIAAGALECDEVYYLAHSHGITFKYWQDKSEELIAEAIGFPSRKSLFEAVDAVGKEAVMKYVFSRPPYLRRKL